jgi:hypothetical protein
VEIADARLLGTVSVSAAWRTLKNAAYLATYLPIQAVRGLMQGGRRSQPATVAQADAPRTRPATLEPSSEPVSASNQGPQFGGDFAVVRRYGNE